MANRCLSDPKCGIVLAHEGEHAFFCYTVQYYGCARIQIQLYHRLCAGYQGCNIQEEHPYDEISTKPSNPTGRR